MRHPIYMHIHIRPIDVDADADADGDDDVCIYILGVHARASTRSISIIISSGNAHRHTQAVRAISIQKRWHNQHTNRKMQSICFGYFGMKINFNHRNTAALVSKYWDIYKINALTLFGLTTNANQHLALFRLQSYLVDVE